MQNDLNYQIIVVGAVRYALGRRTYVVGATVEYVLANIENLTRETRKTIVRDIQEQKDLGWETDIANWHKLLNELEQSNEL